MAEDDQDRAREAEAEREAEIEAEMKRVGEDPDQVQDGRSDLGKQSADSGEVRDEAKLDEQAGDEPERMQEEAPERPDEQRREQRPDEGEREARVDRDDATVPGLDFDDVGKTVVDEDGTELGIVAQAGGEEGAVRVDVDPGVTERVLSRLGWTGEDDVDHVVPGERVRQVTDSVVVLGSEDVEPAGE